jgi:hypothetical protein
MRSRLLGLVLLLALLLGGQFSHDSGVMAQEGDQCLALLTQAAQTVCMDTPRGQVCYANTGVTVVGDGTLADVGDTADITTIESLITVAADSETGDWGVAVVQLPAGLPEDQFVTAIVFGGARISLPIAPETETASADRPTLTVSNSGTAPVNLRNGAGVVYSLVGTLEGGNTAIADGRNEQADWVRIQTDSGPAWVFTPLITWDGDLNTLTVLAPDDITPTTVAATEPFQSFTLNTQSTSTTCSTMPPGLLLQYSGEESASLQINQTTLTFSDATLFVTVTPDSELDIEVLTGSVTATARSVSQEGEAGQTLYVPLGGDDGLTPTAIPARGTALVFADVVQTPLNLLPTAFPCTVVLPDANARVALRVGPGQQRTGLANMRSDMAYTVVGWANDPDGAPWWQLDTGDQDSWAPQSEVGVLGACDTVAEVEPPAMVTAPTTSQTGNMSTAPDLAPTANSVWQMYPGTDQMSGDCSGVPAINFCDHLAAISPASGGVMWRGMEANPYFLSQVQPNVYSYSGPNVLGTGNITITLSFNTETTLSMTQSLVLTSEPSCTHVYNYTGNKNW